MRREWLSDPRIFKLYRQWLKSSPELDQDYSLTENFRPWVFKACGHFFDITQVWDPEYLRLCTEALAKIGSHEAQRQTSDEGRDP